MGIVRQAMKFLSAVGLAAWVGAAGAIAQTAPVYVNSTNVSSGLPPQVDARAFVNQALWEVLDSSQPYSSLNTQFYTNRSSGNFRSLSGFNFFFYTNTPLSNYSGFASVFHNLGRVYGQFSISVQATNIINEGFLGTGVAGIISLTGDSVNLSRSRVRNGYYTERDVAVWAASGLSTWNASLNYSQGSNYINRFDLADIYWGAGTNTSSPQPRGIFLPFNPLFDTFPHRVTMRNIESPTRIPPYTSTTVNTINTLLGSAYAGYAYSNYSARLTSSVVSIVLISTNLHDTNLSMDVRFNAGFLPGNVPTVTPIIQISQVSTDVVGQTLLTNAFYLSDEMSQTAPVNFFNNGDFLQGTMRPSNYQLYVSPELDAFYNFYDTTNLTYDPAITMPFGLSTNFGGETVLNWPETNYVNYNWSAYSIVLSRDRSLVGGGPDFPGMNDPTNSPGRVDIRAGQVDLNHSRLRAENFLSVTTTNMLPGSPDIVDAPVLNYDLGTTNRLMVVSNLVAWPTVDRLHGQVFIWSARWTNTVFHSVIGSTNTNQVRVTYVVTVVDNLLQGKRPVYLYDLALHATNVLVYDHLQVSNSLVIDAENLRLTTNGTNIATIDLPPFAAWQPDNFPRLRNLTNEGRITALLGSEFIGRYFVSNQWVSGPLGNFINSGLVTGNTHVVYASNLVNNGQWEAVGGVLTFHFGQGTFDGQGGAAWLNAQSDITFNGASMVASNQANFRTGSPDVPGALVFNLTNSLNDGGAASGNYWETTDGFIFERLPASGGNLLGTTIRSIGKSLGTTTHRCASRDLGATAAGFTNNLAIGRLILDGLPGSRFFFTGASSNSALYVDYLELRGNATNAANLSDPPIVLDTNVVIYFANMNLSVDKFDRALGGRLRWVPTFMGPNSTTNIVVDGQTLSFNAALLLSRYSDLDGDGIPNVQDNDPVPHPSALNLTVNFVRMPALAAQLRWYGIANSTNHVDYRTGLGNSPWIPLTTIVQGPVSGWLMVNDPQTSGGPRYYRVRVQPQLYNRP